MAWTTYSLEGSAQFLASRKSPPARTPLALLTLLALGVVYGDIGTSPLYALKECFTAEHGLAPTPANVFGVLSLIFWSLILVVTSSTSSSSCARTTAARAASSRSSR